MQHYELLRYLCSLVAICCLTGVVLAASSCNICQDNNVKCVNETHFTFCSSGVASDQLIGCPDGQVCTDFQDNTFCSMSSGKFCVDRCEALSLQSTFECDREAT